MYSVGLYYVNHESMLACNNYKSMRMHCEALRPGQSNVSLVLCESHPICRDVIHEPRPFLQVSTSGRTEGWTPGAEGDASGRWMERRHERDVGDALNGGKPLRVHQNVHRLPARPPF